MVREVLTLVFKDIYDRLSALWLCSCMSLGKLPTILVPQFLYLPMEIRVPISQG